MRSKPKKITRQLQLLGVFALTASLTVSCANRGKKSSAGNNPYSSNPYYTNNNGSNTAETPAATTGATQYPTYDDSVAYTPPTTPVAVEPPVEYPTYTGSGNTGYQDYTASGNSPTIPSYTPNTYPTQPATTTGYQNPGAKQHRVAKGENLYRISLLYGTSVTAIQNMNGLRDNTIYPGQVLTIP